VDCPLGEPFKIIDGDLKDVFKHRKALRIADARTNFNLNQYLIEHYPVERNKNLIIKAGAGTGKTFIMISRIMYLIHRENMSSTDLKEKVYLITFTNEAADNMKERLKKELKNYYLVTGDYRYFEMIYAVEDMKISTIDSLCVKLLRKFSFYLGLGKEFKITSGKYERRNNLINSLNNYIDTIDKAQILQYDINMYNFRKIMEELFEKLENRKIDVLSAKLDLDENKHSELNSLLINVIRDAETATREELRQNNSIKLSDIIINVKLVLNELWKNPSLVNNLGIKYLFVDEFQDTDDVQIDLVKNFKALLGFSLFVVGDIKQCIYRFRGAEENAFVRLKENSIQYGWKWREFSLNKNYRTDKNLLQKFEVFFEKWGRDDRLVYDPKRDKLTSNIEIKCDDDHLKKVTLSMAEFEGKLIEVLKNELTALPKNESIAILVRTNTEVEQIIKLGMKYGINIESDRAGQLYKLDSTLDFYKLVLALQNNKSPRHLYNLYDTGYVRADLPMKEVYLRRRNSEELVDFFYSNCPIEKLNDYLEELKKEPVLKVLREIVLDIEPWENYRRRYNLTDEDALMYKRNLDLLFEKLTEKANTDYLTINKIEQTLGIMIKTGQEEEARENPSALEESGKIKCMTVHKAKGLEFHTVILPFTNDPISNEKQRGKYDFIVNQEDEKVKIGYSLKRDSFKYYWKNSYYLDAAEEEKKYTLNEETRILYVALTRAKCKLCYFEYANYTNQKVNKLLVDLMDADQVECWQKFLQVGDDQK